MKQMFLAALAAVLTAAAADAGPIRSAVARWRCHGGPVAHAVNHVAQVRPVRTTAARVIDAPARIVEARPVAGFLRSVTGSCPGGVCPTSR